jgi:hypothetical protein
MDGFREVRRYSMLTVEQSKSIYKELAAVCVERSGNGLDCSGCKYENNCDDILKEVFKLECLHNR